MGVNWDLNATSLLSLLIALVGVVGFVLRASTQAEAAKQLASAAQQSVVILTAALALHREQVAEKFEKYVDRSALREMEQRLAKAIDKIGEDGAKSADRMSERLDQLLHIDKRKS
jgi:uncharacterized protein YpmS